MKSQGGHFNVSTKEPIFLEGHGFKYVLTVSTSMECRSNTKANFVSPAAVNRSPPKEPIFREGHGFTRAKKASHR
jgi:hypothetical protein